MRDTIYVNYDKEVESYFSASAKKAMDEGILPKALKKKQKAKVLFQGVNYSCEIRLKGDWTDHLRKDKWSLRVALDSGFIYSIKKFSLQFPETRGGEKEALFHDVLISENILTTAYRFIHLVVNGEYWGKFAFEEHPDETLIANQNLPKGPILKFDEEGFWECQRSALKSGENHCVEYPIFTSARVTPFNSKKIYQDSLQLSIFLKGSKELENWQAGNQDSLAINMNKFAKYYALCDVFEMYHGLQWHNQRFYFNPITCLLEPLAYDCFSEDHVLIGKAFLGLFDDHYSTVYFAEQWFVYQLFKNKDFTELYDFYLNNYANEEWSQFAKDYDEIEMKKVLDRIEKRKVALQNFNSLNQKTPRYYSYFEWKKDHPNDIKKYNLNFSNEPFAHVSLRARKMGGEIRIQNFHLKALTIVGIGNAESMIQSMNHISIDSKETIMIPVTSRDLNFIYFKQNQELFKVPIELER